MVTPTQILNARPVPEIEGQADLFEQAADEPVKECPAAGECEAPTADGCRSCFPRDHERK